MNIKIVASGELNDAAQQLIATGRNLAFQLEGRTAKRVLQLDGVTCIVDVKGSSAKIIIVREYASGIILHPRSGVIKTLKYQEYLNDPLLGPYAVEKTTRGVAGGWRDGKTVLTTEYAFPLIDEDNASFALTKEPDADIEGEFLLDASNYGNLYWTNGNPENLVTLSWKGTPTRHFRLPSNINLPGLSTQETATPGVWDDMPYFTVFGTNLYQGGYVLYEAPRYNWPYTGSDRCLVLGAAQDKDETIWIVTQSDRYSVPKYFTIFSDGYRLTTDNAGDKSDYVSNNPGVTISFEKEYQTKRGIYTVLWKLGGPVDGWAFVAEFNTGRVGLPWFGNADGTSFVCGNGDVLTTAGALTQKVSESGTFTETSSLSFGATFTGNNYYEFLENSLIKSGISLAFSASSGSASTEAKNKTIAVDAIVVQEAAVEAPYISGPDVFGAGVYTMVNAFGVVTWTYPEGSCGTGTVTGTDACGRTASMTVRLPLGYWTGPTGVYYTTGGTRLVYSIYSTTCGVVTGGGCYSIGTVIPCKAGVSAPLDSTDVGGGTTISSIPTCVSGRPTFGEAYCPGPWNYFTDSTCFYGVLVGSGTWVCP